MVGGLLVVGAGGFVGAHLMHAARAHGIGVVGVVRRRATSWRLADAAGADIFEADVTRPDDIAQALRAVRPAAIINAAGSGVAPTARDPDMLRAVNVTAVTHLLDAAARAGVRRFIHLGSCSEYGDVAGPVDEATPTNPKDAYGASKAEGSARVLAHAGGTMEAAVARLFNIWGPLESAHRLLPAVIGACRARRPLDLTAGTQAKDYSYVGDVAQWLIGLAQAPAPIPGRLVNVAAGRQMAVRDLVSAVARRLDGLELMRFGAKALPPGEAQTGPVNTARLDALLPGRPFTPLEAGIDALLAAPPPP